MRENQQKITLNIEIYDKKIARQIIDLAFQDEQSKMIFNDHDKRKETELSEMGIPINTDTGLYNDDFARFVDDEEA